MCNHSCGELSLTSRTRNLSWFIILSRSKQARYRFLGINIKMTSNIPHNRPQRTDWECLVRGDAQVMLSALVSGQSYVAACLARNTVAHLGKSFCQFRA
jgi:hypothetical protein